MESIASFKLHSGSSDSDGEEGTDIDRHVVWLFPLSFSLIGAALVIPPRVLFARNNTQGTRKTMASNQVVPTESHGYN